MNLPLQMQQLSLCYEVNYLSNGGLGQLLLLIDSFMTRLSDYLTISVKLRKKTKLSQLNSAHVKNIYPH